MSSLCLQGIPPQQHPVIVLPTVDYDVMQAILEFIYQGQVNVRQSQLGAFLQVAETFSIQGLADDETKKNAGKVRLLVVEGWRGRVGRCTVWVVR